MAAGQRLFSSERKEVKYTQDFARILAIPRRDMSPDQLEYIRRELTSALKMPDGKMTLRLEQAHALHDMGCFGGLVGIMGVGVGKTLTSLLAPAMFHPAPARPLLVTRASLITKTQDARNELKQHWRIPSGMQMISFEAMGRVGCESFLEQLWRPDLIIIDECQFAKNKRAGVTRRLVRYMKAHPDTRVVVLSGTFFKASIEDGAHLVRWALKENAPVPTDDFELKTWADALDDEKRVNPLNRHTPGVLLQLSTPDEVRELGPLVAARRGFQRRLHETPGVVATTGEEVACSIYVNAIQYEANAQTEENFYNLRRHMVRPDGWGLTEAMEAWAVARKLALGLHYEWDPKAPDEWLVQRKLWAKFVRETLKRSRTLDTEKQVAIACQEGGLDPSALDGWAKIRPTFTPRPKPVWHDDTALAVCQDWAKKNTGIIWTEHTFFARELAKRAGLPYYGREGLDDAGNSLDKIADRVLAGDAKPFTLVASVKANSTGRNLQGWSKNLVTSCPTEAAEWEQLIGRTHRTGQRAEEVTVDVLVGCWEHFDAWTKAVSLAEATKDTQGTGQKILLADVTFPSELEVTHRVGARWQKHPDEKGTDVVGL